MLGVVVADEQRILEANDAYLDIIGYTREDLATGRIAWREITPPEWAGGDQDAVAQLRRAARAGHSRRSTYTATGTGCRSSSGRR